MILIRKGVFETNSSSTHSIVIKKEERIPYGEDITNILFDNFRRDEKPKNITIWFTDFAEENYCRQDGRILIGTEDKLNLYLTLLAGDIISQNKTMICEEFKEALTKKITKLNEEFFNKLGINLIVMPPEMEDKYSQTKHTYYADISLPYIEDSYGAFDKFLDLVEKDYIYLYSYLYNPESFVILGGDEYDTFFVLEDMLKKSIPENAIVLGHLKEEN